MFCEACGTKNPPDAAFCTECGAPLSERPQPAGAEPQEATEASTPAPPAPPLPVPPAPAASAPVPPVPEQPPAPSQPPAPLTPVPEVPRVPPTPVPPITLPAPAASKESPPPAASPVGPANVALPTEVVAAPKKGGSGAIVAVLVIVVLVIAAAGAAVWYFKYYKEEPIKDSEVTASTVDTGVEPPTTESAKPQAESAAEQPPETSSPEAPVTSYAAESPESEAPCGFVALHGVELFGFPVGVGSLSAEGRAAAVAKNLNGMLSAQGPRADRLRQRAGAGVQIIYWVDESSQRHNLVTIDSKLARSVGAPAPVLGAWWLAVLKDHLLVLAGSNPKATKDTPLFAAFEALAAAGGGPQAYEKIADSDRELLNSAALEVPAEFRPSGPPQQEQRPPQRTRPSRPPRPARPPAERPWPRVPGDQPPE